MSDLTIRDLQDSWACKHVQGELSPEQRRVELLELLDEVRADAWDEGHAVGWNDRGIRHLVPDGPTKNPYRADQTEGDDEAH